MKRSINLLPNLGSNPSIELNKPRFKVYSFGGRVVADGGTFEADNCMYNTINNSLFDTASLIISPNGYKEGKLYSVIPSDGSGDLSVTRATTATRVNSAGLVELVPYNLLTYSQDFSNGSWLNDNTSETANTTTSPSGLNDAYSLIENNATGQHSIYKVGVSVASNAVVTLSFFAKQNTRKFIGVNDPYTGNGAFFDLENGTALGDIGTISSKTIQDAGNGWYRCSVTFQASGTLTGGQIFMSTNGTSGSYAGNGTSGIYIWGAQLVEGSTAKDYQKTETRLNIPRLDYSNGTCPSILVEPQRTNSCLYSENFTAQWLGGGVTPNTTIAPDGNLTADTLDTTVQLWQQIPATINTTYTISLWVKLGTATNLCLVVNNTVAWNTIGGQSFDATDGLNTSTWTRISYTFTTSSSALSAINYHIGANNQTGLTQSAGTVFIWGAQFEVGSYPTSYIPTTSASVTRNADVISKTGISSLIGQTEGVIFADINRELVQANGQLIAINNVGASNELAIQFGLTNNLQCYLYTGGGFPFVIETTFTTSGRFKIAFAYKNNDFVVYVNGTQVGSSSSGSVPALSIFNILPSPQATINATALWKTRLTNDQLTALTTI